MADADLTVAILREIRDEIRGTNGRFDQLGGRVDRLHDDLVLLRHETNARLEKIEETLRDLAAQQLMLTRYVRNVVDRHEQDLASIKERLARLEERKH